MFSILFGIVSFDFAHAQSSSFTYEGRLFSSSGVPLLESVDVKFQILNPAGTCVLYEEVQSGIDLSSTKGAFSLGVGSAASDAKRSANFRGAYNPSMISVFRNGATLSGIPVAGCAAGTYVAGATDTRVLRVHVTKGSTTETLSPDLVINTVPSAQVAASLQGFLPSDFLRLDVANGISGNIGLTATGTGAGQTREFRFYELAANGVEYSAFKAPDAMATSLTYVLPSGAPAAGDVLKATVPSSGVVTLSWGADAGAGGGISNFNGSNQSSQSFTAVDIAAAVTAPAWSTNIGTGAHTLQIPMAVGAGVTGGLITKTEHTAFSAKVDRAGDTMTGNLLFTGTAGISVGGTGTIAMGTNKITGVGDPTNAQEAATKAYVDSQNSGKLGGTLTATRIPYASGASTLVDSANFTYTAASGAMTIGGTAPSITSNDAMTIAAGGTNKNVVLTPSGTGYTLLNGRVGIGMSTPGYPLDILGGAIHVQDNSNPELILDADVSAAVPKIFLRSASTGNPVIEHSNSLNIRDTGGTTEIFVQTGTRNVGIGPSASPVDPVSISAAINASATRSLVNLSNTALVAGSANGTYVGANPAAFTGNFIDLQVAGASKFSVSSTGVITGNGSGITGIPGAISGLTSGRIAVATGATTIGDSADFTYSGGQLNVVGTPAKARINNVYIGNSGASSLHGANGSGGLINLQNLVSDAFSFTSYLNTTASNVFVMNARPSGSSENLLQIQKAGTGVLTVDNSGKLGIGITNPGYKLDVNGGINMASDFFYIGGGAFLGAFGTSDHNIMTGTGQLNIYDSVGSNVRMVVMNGGNVGIGTAAPLDTLSIGTAVNASATRALVNLSNTALSAGSANGTYIGVNIPAFTGDLINYQLSNSTQFRVDYSGSINARSIGGAASAPSFSVNGPTSGPLILRGGSGINSVNINAAGTIVSTDSAVDVGIGTTTPASKLHVGVAPATTANYGLVSLGSGFFDGATAGFFTGHASGTLVAANVAGAFGGDLINLQAAGVQKFKVDKDGKIYGDGSTLSNVSGALSGLTATRIPYATSATALGDDSALVWDATNDRLGIGVATPTDALHVKGQINMRNSSGADLFLVQDLGNDVAIKNITNATGKMRLGTYSYDDTLNLYQGKVGIGTTVPVSGFHVNAAPTASANYGLVSVGATTAFDGATAGYFGSGSTSSANGTFIAANAATGFGGDLMNLQLAGATRLRMSAGGYLTVSGTIDSPNITSWNWHNSAYTGSGAAAYPGSGQMKIINNDHLDANTTAATLFQVKNTSSLDQTAYIGAVSNTGGANYTPSIVFGQQTALAGYTERMRIDASGNVGIGTTSPQSRFHISAAPVATANYGTFSIGSAPFDGTTAGFFAGDVAGTMIAGNAASGFVGDLISLQTNGVQLFKVDGIGKTQVRYSNSYTTAWHGAASGLTIRNADTTNGTGSIIRFSSLDLAGNSGHTAVIGTVNTSHATNATSGDFVVATYSSGTATERLRVLSGGNVGVGTAAPTANSRLAVKDGHIQIQQTTAPTATVHANAGTGATCAVSNATDSAGKITLMSGTSGWAATTQCTITFNKTFTTAPIVSLTPGDQWGAFVWANAQVYVTPSTTTFTVNFNNAMAGQVTMIFYYTATETQ